jgi:hypothetical protein
MSSALFLHHIICMCYLTCTDMCAFLAITYQPNVIFMSLLYLCLLWVVHQICTLLLMCATWLAQICVPLGYHIWWCTSRTTFMSLLYLCLLWVVHYICTLLFCVRHLAFTDMCASWLSHMFMYQPNVQSPTGGANPCRRFHAQRVVAQQNDTPRVPSLARRNLYDIVYVLGSDMTMNDLSE